MTSVSPAAALHDHVTFRPMLLLSVYWTAILLPTGLVDAPVAPARRPLPERPPAPPASSPST